MNIVLLDFFFVYLVFVLRYFYLFCNFFRVCVVVFYEVDYVLWYCIEVLVFGFLGFIMFLGWFLKVVVMVISMEGVVIFLL